MLQHLYKVVCEWLGSIVEVEFDTEREAMTWAAVQEQGSRFKALKLLRFDENQKRYVMASNLSLAPVIKDWEMDAVKGWSVSEIKNRIWSYETSGQPIPGCVSVTALRLELINRGEQPNGYHNT